MGECFWKLRLIHLLRISPPRPAIAKHAVFLEAILNALVKTHPTTLKTKEIHQVSTWAFFSLVLKS